MRHVTCWALGLLILATVGLPVRPCLSLTTAHQADTKMLQKEQKLGIAKQTRRMVRQVVAGLNVTQNSYNNWASGGENTLAYTLTLDTKLENDQPKSIYTLTGKFAFGQTKQGRAQIRNSMDKIDVKAVYTFKLDSYANPYLAGGFDTQFTTGYDYSVKPKRAKSDFWDPVYITISAGAGYHLATNLKTRLGIAIKETITKKYNIYADRKETPQIEKTRFETGIEFVTDFEAEWSQNLRYVTRLGLFSSFEQLQEIDIKWENTWTAKVAKYISVNLEVLVYRDENVTTKTQIKETLSIGLTYSFF